VRTQLLSAARGICVAGEALFIVDTLEEVLAFDPVEGLKDAILLPVMKGRSMAL
jgi:hypothetical protein